MAVLEKHFRRFYASSIGTPVQIVIPIFNAAAATRVCIESVLAHSDERHRLVLIDDGSTDPAIAPLLAGYALKCSRVTPLSMEKNSGFVATANRGLALGESDVVLLNSDTVVTAGWLEKLEVCLSSRPNLGIVSPLTNNGFLLSIPKLNHPNTLPEGISVAEYAELVASVSHREYPEIPVAIGFCMWIRREVIRSIGYFDKVFLRGYGEELDFCYRAKRAGFGIACADDCFIYHEGNGSFGKGQEWYGLLQRNQIILSRYWPNYPGDLDAFQAQGPFAALVGRLEAALCLRS